MTRLVPLGSQVFVADDVLANPHAYRETVLGLPFGPVTPLPGLTFQGIASDPDWTLPLVIATAWPALDPRLSFFRQSPLDQAEPTFLHTDEDMGEWSGIFYLSPTPPVGDGTTFWRHRDTGLFGNLPAQSVEERAGFLLDRAQWEPWLSVAAVFNRLLLFASPLVHSRSLEANYGSGEDARLIQVVFGSGALAPEGEA